MTPWLETLGAVCLVAFGAWLGVRCSRLPRPYWLAGYVVPLAVLALLGIGRAFPSLTFTPPFSWLLSGRARFAIIAVAVATMLLTPLSRLPHRRQKVLVCVFMVVIGIYHSVLPFLVPALIRNRLLGLETLTTFDGICLQTTDYTCGPAAAVTALRRFGLEAEEGELAVHCYTSPIAGTPPDFLCHALEDLYGAAGLTCEYRFFEDIDALPTDDGALTIAVIKLSFLVDHYVVVLEVTEDAVHLGDPMKGGRILSHEEFREIWRYSGVVLRRSS